MPRWTRTPIAALVAVALLAASALPAAAEGADEAQADLQSRVDEFVGLINGGVAAVTIRDGVTEMAAAGIANIEGDPMTVETPMLVGVPAASVVNVLALRLVEAGLLDLDAPVVSYVPDAPVAEGSTVRQLLELRAGIPAVGTDWSVSYLDDPDHTWTTDSIVATLDRSKIGAAGDFVTGYANTLVQQQVIEAATGSDFADALQEWISRPLDLPATIHAEGDVAMPEGLASGWAAADASGEAIITDEWEAMRSLRPTTSSAADLARFLEAVLAGELVSPGLMQETILRDDIEDLGYGFARPDELFEGRNPLSALDTPYYGIAGYWFSGINGAIAGAPSTGDLVVVLANNEDLDAAQLAGEILGSWAMDPLATGALDRSGQGLFRYGPLFTCDVGQSYAFDLPPCVADADGVHLSFASAIEMEGTFDGSAVGHGVWTEPGDGSFTYRSVGLFMGEVEGCGYGTFYYTVDDASGTADGASIVYEVNTMNVVPGGTLSLVGTIDLTGFESPREDGTATIDYTASYGCDSTP